MTRVAVLGSSGASAHLATILKEDPRVTEIIRGHSSDPAPAIFGSDVVVGPRAPDPETEKAAAIAAIVGGVPYISTAASPDVVETLMSLHGRAVEAGSLVLIGNSWSPGLSNLMVMIAAAELDPPFSVMISWAASSARQTAEAALARGAEALSGEAYVIEDGTLRSFRAGSEHEQVFMPEPVGWVKLRLARASEPLTLPRRLVGLDELVVFGGLVDPLTNLLAAMPPSQVTNKLAEKVLSAAGKLKRSQPWSALRVDVTGGREGITTTVSLGIVDQLSNLLTAPVVVAALMVAELGHTRSGVLSPEDVFDPANFFARLAYHGVRLARLERVGL